MREDREDRIIEAIDELAEYALAHGLVVIHRSLSAANALIRDFAGTESNATDSKGEWFGEVLDVLISYVKRRGWSEVQDHLLEAKMAWDERDQGEPDGNILKFTRRSEQ